MLKLKRIAWALRKTSLPIDSKALVLDIGSGNNPHPRSDILLDRLTGSEHRAGAPIVIDRPTVLGNALKLPFKDKSFDYIIASHVLEHMPDPDQFLQELQRVGKAGYIETPNAIYERLNPSKSHCLEIAKENDSLLIYKKSKELMNDFVSSQDILHTQTEWSNLWHNNPEMFHVCFFWNDQINYKIINPETSSAWIYDPLITSETCHIVDDSSYLRKGWRKLGMSFLNYINSKRREKRILNLDIVSLLMCPKCSGDIVKKDMLLYCNNCKAEYTTTPHINLDID